MFTQTLRGYFGVQSYIYRRITGAIPERETLQLDIIYDDESFPRGREEKKMQPRRYSLAMTFRLWRVRPFLASCRRNIRNSVSLITVTKHAYKVPLNDIQTRSRNEVKF